VKILKSMDEKLDKIGQGSRVSCKVPINYIQTKDQFFYPEEKLNTFQNIAIKLF
tara:strand:- start:334 stop:495 length:162 start_codon:yes stop_codon:yes gene_type:complete